MNRWSAEETAALVEIRRRLKDELAAAGQFPEVIGDRKLLRFYRGHNGVMDKVCEMISKFLTWRKEHGVDAIREAIVSGGMNHPKKFPNGQKILDLIPQIVVNHEICDKTGAPICVEQYHFSPHHVLQHISLQDYITFVTYSLEFKSAMLEQLSEKLEREKLQTLPPDATEPYGVILHTCVIRDLSGVGFEHVGHQGQEIIRAVIGVASDNYPELMHKCHMINVPWLFNTVWWFVKGLLAARTLAKVNVLGTNFSSVLLQEIDAANLPKIVGGTYDKEAPDFEFDTSEGGLLSFKPIEAVEETTETDEKKEDQT